MGQARLTRIDAVRKWPRRSTPSATRRRRPWKVSTWRSAAPWSGSITIATTIGTTRSAAAGNASPRPACSSSRPGRPAASATTSRPASTRRRPWPAPSGGWRSPKRKSKRCGMHRAIDHAVDEYRGARTPLSSWLESEDPKALAALRRMMDNLEDYLALHALAAARPVRRGAGAGSRRGSEQRVGEQGAGSGEETARSTRRIAGATAADGPAEATQSPRLATPAPTAR